MSLEPLPPKALAGTVVEHTHTPPPETLSYRTPLPSCLTRAIGIVFSKRKMFGFSRWGHLRNFVWGPHTGIMISDCVGTPAIIGA